MLAVWRGLAPLCRVDGVDRYGRGANQPFINCQFFLLMLIVLLMFCYIEIFAVDDVFVYV